MKSNRVIVFSLAMCFSLICVIGMNWENCEAQNKQYIIAYVGPLSGPNADFGIRGQRAVEMRIDEVNSQGGIQIGGVQYKLKLVPCDSQGKVDVAATAIQRVIERDKASFVVGGQLSSPTLAMIDVAERLQTPFVVSGAISIKISQKIKERHFKYVYQSSPTSVQRSSSEVDAILQLIKPKTAYIVSQDTDWGRDTVNSFMRLISAGNVKLATDYVSSGATDFSSLLVKIQSMKPDVIYAILTGSEMYSFAEQRYSVGIKSVLFSAGSTPASDIYIKTIGVDKANKTVVNLVWMPTTEKGKALAAKFKKLYGSSPSDLEAQNYDATSLVLDALAKSKSPSKPDVANALLKAEINGLRGHQKFREGDHTIPGLTFVIGQIQNGKYAAVWPSSLAGAKLLR